MFGGMSALRVVKREKFRVPVLSLLFHLGTHWYQLSTGDSEEPWPESQQPAILQSLLPLTQSNNRAHIAYHFKADLKPPLPPSSLLSLPTKVLERSLVSLGQGRALGEEGELSKGGNCVRCHAVCKCVQQGWTDLQRWLAESSILSATFWSIAPSETSLTFRLFFKWFNIIVTDYDTGMLFRHSWIKEGSFDTAH